VIAPIAALLSANLLLAQTGDCLIRPNVAGPVKAGMTVRQARAALRGATVKKSEDGDGLTLFTVQRDGKTVMDLYPDEEDKVTETSKLELFRVYDPKCATADGIHPGMPLREVEQKFGPVLKIVTSEIESREEAEFKNQPSWLSIQVGNGEAGVYPSGKRCTRQYTPAAKVVSLWVSHAVANPVPEDPAFCDTPPPAPKK
jgi:hypothetical protein